MYGAILWLQATIILYVVSSSTDNRDSVKKSSYKEFIIEKIRDLSIQSSQIVVTQATIVLSKMTFPPKTSDFTFQFFDLQ